MTADRKGAFIAWGLALLTAVPFAAGLSRLAGLAGGTAVTPENARFFAAPLPVILHIVTASLFCILGAFQFSAGFRRRRPGWHRISGRILIPAGIVAGLTGLWMTLFYPLGHLQGQFLFGFRLLIGAAMVLFLYLGWAAILRRDVLAHQAWLARAYAIGQGAGTQAVTGLSWLLIFGPPNDLTRDLLLIASWLINLGVAEWYIRRPNRRRLEKEIRT